MKFAMISFAAAIAPTMAAEFSEVYLLNAGTCAGTGGVIITENAECIAAIEKLDETEQTGTNGKKMYISAQFGSTIINNGAGMRGRPTGCTWETDFGNMEMWARSNDAECGSLDYNCVCKCTTPGGCGGSTLSAAASQAATTDSVASVASVAMPLIPDVATLWPSASGEATLTFNPVTPTDGCTTTYGSIYSDTNTCPSGFVRVMTSAECDAADAALGIRASGSAAAGEHVRGRDQFMNSEPGGCYQFSGKYHLNLAPNGVGVASGGTHLYCKQTVCFAPVVPAPITDSPTASPTEHPTASPTDALTASPTCVHEDCQEWDCDTWCECFDETKASVYTANNCDEDEDPCDCPGWSPAPTCANVELVGQGECGMGHGSLTCPTAAAPSPWCNNPSYPLRLGVAWCTENFCNQCGDMFGIVYVGCTNGVQAVANSCQACGHNSRGPCRSGAKCLGRTSLRSDYGCSANLCKTCGVVGTKPCNNGDGQQICDAGLAPRRYGNPSENNCEVEQLTCGAPWTGACSTLPNVGGTFYNVIPGTKAPDMNNEFVHGGTFIL